MKKEHWLYVVIAILVIWIIASYVGKPNTSLAPTGSENEYGETTTSTPQVSGAVNTGNVSNVTNDDFSVTNIMGVPVATEPASGAVVSSPALVGTVGAPAGPNKGVLTASVVSSNEIVVNNQPASNMAQIAKVAMAQNGWVAVRVDMGGVPGNIWGAQRFDVGAYAGGQVELVHSLVAGNIYYAVICVDNGDKVFDHNVDLPVVGADGKPVMVKFVAN